MQACDYNTKVPWALTNWPAKMYNMFEIRQACPTTCENDVKSVGLLTMIFVHHFYHKAYVITEYDFCAPFLP